MVERNKDFKFLLVGGGQEEAGLKELVKELNLQEHVIFSGRVKHDDINKYYSVVDMLVYPRISKRITELVTPLKPLEAMALQKIVVASDVGGLKELIEDQVTGLLFKAGDIEDLAQKCNWALANPQVTLNIAQQGRNYVI